LLVELGQRGSRARREDGKRARRRIVLGALVSVGLALGGLALAPAARPWVAVPAALAGGALLFILRRSERTLAGELVASAALTAAALPVGIASGLTPPVGVAVCAVFYATSLVSTVEVRAIARRDTNLAGRIAAWTIAATVVLLLALDAPGLAVSALPMMITVIAIAVSRPKPAHLRRLGWTLATASLVMAGAVVVAARGAP
jgi:hypothetical protein